MNTTKIGVGGALALAAGCFGFAGTANADVTTLGFEAADMDLAGMVGQLNDPVTDQFSTAFGMSFSIEGGIPAALDAPVLSQVGSQPITNNTNDAYWSQYNGDFDSARPGFEDQLGEWFLRTKSPLEPDPGALIITYTHGPVAMASGEIWDIDGDISEGAGEFGGIEQWLVSALDGEGNVIDTILSPIGDSVDPELSLDSAPWTWMFERAQTDIYAVRLEMVGDRELGAGNGFDNFSWSTDVIPAPGTLLPMAGLGLAVARRRRR